MAVLNGFLPTLSQEWATDHLNMAPLDTLGDALYEERAVSAIGTGKSGTLSRTPINVVPRNLSGSLARSFEDDFYNQIHIYPPMIDVGNVVSAEAREVTVWNAYLESRTLEDLTSEDAEGVALSGQPNPPTVFGALEERTWAVAVLPGGPPVIDATITWQFTGEPPAQLSIVGNRVTAWTFAPDWSRGVDELLEWLTDILPSETGHEQSRALRDLPRRSFAFDILTEGRDRALLDMSLFDWGARMWALPIWPDVQWLPVLSQGSPEISCSTQKRDYSDEGLALLLGESARDYEVLEVLSVEPDRLLLRNPLQRDWPAGTRLYPARAARLSDQPRMRRLTDTAIRAGVEFLLAEPSDWSLGSGLPEYRGWPVLEWRPAESEDLTATYERLLQVLDNGTAAPHVEDTAGLAFPFHSHRWLLEGAQQHAEFRGFCHELKGRQKHAWVATWMNDLEVVQPVPVNASSLDIAHVQYVRFGSGQEGRRDLRIELHDGTVWYRRVLAYTELDSETERLGLDTPLDQAFAPGDVRLISWMALTRLSSDRVEIKHITDIDGAATSQLLFRGVRDDL